MRKVGIVICNYNKRDYVVKNIQSLKKQTYTDFDIYVVDNASTDGSTEFLLETFEDEISLICNTENLGGSGGFNTGIDVVMKGQYEYIMLLDNDVILDEGCVENCINVMEKNNSVGMLGCEILKMDYPDRIQEFGPVLNYEVMNFELSYGGEIDNGQLPDLQICDYVPACAMMVRREVIEKIGMMPQENFIYYDDITWGVRCHRAGYEVAVTSKAKAWHKGGAAVNPTTFASYYLNRNKLRFFMRYMATVCDDLLIEDSQIEERAEIILKDIFQGIYSCNKNGMPNMSKTRMEAFLDAIWDVTGKAESYKIRQREMPDNKFDRFVLANPIIHIYMNGYWENTRRIVNWLYELEKMHEVKFDIYISDEETFVGKELLGITIVNDTDVNVEKCVDLYMCKHIYELEIEKFDKKWVDGWRNTVIDEEDYESQKLYSTSYELFRTCFFDILVNRIKDMVTQNGQV